MKVLVTGSAGSLGRAIAPKLKQGGHEILGVDFANNLMDHEISCDLRDRHAFDSIYRGFQPDVVMHLAATIYGVAGFNENGYHILSDDLLMTKNVLDSSRCHMVYLSSSMVYEKVGLDISREDELLKWPAPVTGYGLSKYVGERMVVEWSKLSYDRIFTIWRPFNIITPYEDAGKELGYSHVFADFFENILVKKMNPLPIIGSGYQTRCFTWIDNVADCIVDNLENPSAVNDAFNIGNYEPVTMRDLAKMIFDEAVRRGHLSPGNLEFETVKSYKDDVQFRAPSVSRAREILGFQADVKLIDSIRKLMDHWEKKL